MYDIATMPVSAHPLIRHPHTPVPILPVQMCGSVAYYATLATYPHVIIDDCMRYDKRFKSVHRYTIADPHGPLTLTIPVSRPAGARRWCDILLSEHGHWWTQHHRSLATAYSAGPFYEFYIDRMLPLFSADTVGRYRTVTALALAWDTLIRSILHLDTQVTPASSISENNATEAFKLIPPHDLTVPTPYYQLTPTTAPTTLTILDLIFNHGPEAPIILSTLARHNNL